MNVTVVEVAGNRRAVVLDWIREVRIAHRAGFIIVEALPIFGGDSTVVWQYPYPVVSGSVDFVERCEVAQHRADEALDWWVALLADVPRPEINVIPL